MDKIATCLWFDGKAEEAAKFYTGIFRNSSIDDVMHYGDAGPGTPGSVLSMTFRLEGREFIALNGGPQFTFSPAISMFVKCESQAEVDVLWDKLLEGGGAPQQCGWLTGRYGISWQIVPTALGKMLKDKDPAKARRVMQAMMQMVKLDVNALEAAYAQP
ncbi:3-demethylubiquinone-9 3-methyltransferase [Paraburkholderia piptadeniae]|uniref:3-demethylubiquinone-9 3-methyltransferase n=1 Tax=Paraburkholderia piptadeniae TaxID=1701573 RepID=A0A1N7SDG7_9BURK|nr:VOC family protein [Paraburkholderia piptadeniae]SIT45435.1 3-demethylubiquinone-9 3-methyltransferase [Paraburkholderia piptadeniae]